MPLRFRGGTSGNRDDHLALVPGGTSRGPSAPSSKIPAPEKLPELPNTFTVEEQLAWGEGTTYKGAPNVGVIAGPAHSPVLAEALRSPGTSSAAAPAAPPSNPPAGGGGDGGGEGPVTP